MKSEEAKSGCCIAQTYTLHASEQPDSLRHLATKLNMLPWRCTAACAVRSPTGHLCPREASSPSAASMTIPVWKAALRRSWLSCLRVQTQWYKGAS
ncbi:hypothetical protein WJX72_008109 [[Myrmecia] bisecta]|uniref:Uncharacterized protein n=1 Tax=[Myrmecia] bisecta TaxID=41462 RepID=A0AAW1P1Y5_9CHLO